MRTLLGEMDIAGALVTADAAHTCADTARYLAGDCHAEPPSPRPVSVNGLPRPTPT